LGITCLLPLWWVVGKGFSKGMMSYRIEAYAVRDGLYYNHFRNGQIALKKNVFGFGRLWG
jgi:hypothetical protein